MPDDLGNQIEPLFEAIRALGWPLVQIEGVEADDMIGTLAREAEKHGLRCVISTGDKDLAQLVSDRVTLVNTMSNERLDPEGVRVKFGVPPERMLDYLTLVGDSVDNVPGVEKVGPKTAAKWLAEYGSLEEVVGHAAEIGGAVGENLRKSLDWLPKARGLLAVKCDVELPFEMEELKLAPRDEKRLSGIFSRFGFKSWLKDAPSAVDEPPAPEQSTLPPGTAPERSYETLFTEADLKRWLKELEAAELVSFDTETTSLDPMQARLVGMSFAVAAGHAAYLPLAHDYAGAPQQLGVEPALAILKPWLESARHKKLGQNVKYDEHVLANHGIALRGIAHDTLLQSYVLESQAHKEAGQPFNLGSPKQIAEIFFEKKGMPVTKKTPSGAPSTDEDVLEKPALDHPLARILLEHREISKLKSTYTDKLPKMVNPRTGRVHTNYGQATAVTGRLASNDPNLQNIPVRTTEGRRIREAFVAPKEHAIVSADYSQVELRIMAHISGDGNLLSAFAAGEDIHRATAAEVFGRSLKEVTPEERRYAKVINFGLIYGMSAFGLAQQLGLERATAQAYIASYFTRYPGVAKYMEEVRRTARERGYVETVFGRRLWLPET